MFPTRYTQANIQSLHQKTLWILDHIGVLFQDESARTLLASHGARIEGERVFIPESLLNHALSTVPRSFTIHGLEKAAHIGGDTPIFSGASSGIFIEKNGKLIPPTTEDFIATQKLNATSEVLDIANCQQIYVSDIPQAHRARIQTALTLQYVKGPVATFCGNYEESKISLELAKQFHQGAHEYYALGLGNMISPLQYGAEAIGAIRAYAEYNQPIEFACCSTCALTSPITIGGTVIQNNAEVLAGIVYGQLLRPGLPMIYGNVSAASDLRYGSAACGAVESLAIIPLVRALTDFYKIPVRTGGAYNDAKQVDYQAGSESSLALHACIYNDIDFIMHAVGEYDGYNAYSMEKQMLDEEVIASALHLRNLDLFDEEDIDVEAISDGIEEEQFMTTEHTMDRLRSVQFGNKLMNRNFITAWEGAGKPSIVQTAAQEAAARLARYVPNTLSEAQEKLIDEALTY